MRRILVATLVLLSFALLAEAQIPNPQIEAAFEEQLAFVTALPPDALPHGLRQSLLTKLRIGHRRYLRGKPCPAANILTAFMFRSKAVSRRPAYAALGTDLYYRGMLLREDLLLSLPEDAPCPKQPVGTDCFDGAPWADLVAIEVNSQPANPSDGDSANLHLTVVNRGGVSVDQAPVVFFEQDLPFTELVVDIPACEVVDVPVQWPGGSQGVYWLEARIDPDQTLDEPIRSNNDAGRDIGVVFEATRPWEAPDLVLERLAANPARPTSSDSVDLEVTVWHPGEEPLREILVSFLVDGVVIDEVLLDELEGGFETPIAGSWLATEPGRHYLTAEARLLSGPVERELDNNSESIPLNAGGDPVLADLQASEIRLDPEHPSMGDPVTLTAEITNIGWAPASDFDVYFLAEEDPAPPLLASRSKPQPAAPLVLAVVNVPFLDPEETVEVEATIASLDRPEITVWVHVDPTGAVAKVEAPSILGKRIAAVDAAELCKTDQTTWFSVGPSWLSNGWVGRIDSLALDPNDPSTIFAASPGGGVWRSLSGGAWTPLTDRMPTMKMGAMVMDPIDPDILYVGSASGLFKTIDGGNTWKVFANTQIGSYFNSLLIDDSGGSSFTLYAGTNWGLWRYEGTNRYLLQSQYSEWKRLKVGSITSLSQYPDDPDRFLVGTLHTKTQRSQAWRSKPGGPPTGETSWEDLSDGTHGLPNDSVGGMRVAVAPSDSSIMYAALRTPERQGIDPIPRLWQLYRSPDGGNTWQLKQSEVAEIRHFGYWENWYNAYVAVDPLLPNTIYLGSIQAYRSDDGGETLNRILDIHADQHALAFHPDNPQIVYFTGDGGIFRCTGRGASCTSLNEGLRVTMFYDVATATSDPSRVIGGTQDNGTIRFNGSDVWDMIRSGDGRYSEIDPFDANTLYSQHQYLGSTLKTSNGSASAPKWYAAPGLPSDKVVQGISYLFIHPNDSDVVLGAGPKVYEHSSASSDWSTCPSCPSWSDIGPAAASSSVRRVAIDPTSNRYFAGLANGQLWVSESMSSAWAQVFSHPSGKAVTGMSIDPWDSNRIFLTFEGWGKTNGPLRVWMIERVVVGPDRREDLIYWQSTNITGNLPANPTIGSGHRQSDMVAAHPGQLDTIFVATNRGVYRGRGTYADSKWTWNWDAYNCQLPWANFTDLEIHPVTFYLFAATYGRGLWATPLPAPD